MSINLFWDLKWFGAKSLFTNLFWRLVDNVLICLAVLYSIRFCVQGNITFLPFMSADDQDGEEDQVQAYRHTSHYPGKDCIWLVIRIQPILRNEYSLNSIKTFFNQYNPTKIWKLSIADQQLVNIQCWNTEEGPNTVAPLSSIS